MTEPITPAPVATTPGSGEQVPTPAAAPVGEKKEGAEGTVTISTKEFADLQRNSARLTSLQKRGNKKTVTAPADVSGDADPELVSQFNTVTAEKQQLEQDIMKRDVRDRVREILDKDIYKDLPASTKKMILKNPSSLSKADNLDDAIDDIEDFINEALDDIGKPATETTPEGTAPVVETKHETPVPVSTGTAPATEQALEKTEGLQGSSRSKAILRNSIRKQFQGVKE